MLALGAFEQADLAYLSVAHPPVGLIVNGYAASLLVLEAGATISSLIWLISNVEFSIFYEVW